MTIMHFPSLMPEQDGFQSLVGGDIVILADKRDTIGSDVAEVTSRYGITRHREHWSLQCGGATTTTTSTTTITIVTLRSYVLTYNIRSKLTYVVRQQECVKRSEAKYI